MGKTCRFMLVLLTCNGKYICFQCTVFQLFTFLALLAEVGIQLKEPLGLHTSNLQCFRRPLLYDVLISKFEGDKWDFCFV